MVGITDPSSEMAKVETSLKVLPNLLWRSTFPVKSTME